MSSTSWPAGVFRISDICIDILIANCAIIAFGLACHAFISAFIWWDYKEQIVIDSKAVAMYIGFAHFVTASLWLYVTQRMIFVMNRSRL